MKTAEHTIGVAYTSVCLAMRYGEDLHKAELAGLLHDCAKCIPDDIKLDKCKRNNIPITKAQEQSPSLLHAKLGAFIAADHYRIKDQDILNAIENHTTGRPAMSLLEKIVFVADYIEPRRIKRQTCPNCVKWRLLILIAPFTKLWIRRFVI